MNVRVFTKMRRYLSPVLMLLLLLFLSAWRGSEEAGAAQGAEATDDAGIGSELSDVSTASGTPSAFELGSAFSGVTDNLVLFGQSAVLTGSAGELGRNAKLGIRAAFREINDQGGVHGRLLQLLTLDDGYEPERAIENTHKLIKEERVFALVGAVGTTTARASVPIAADHGVPFIAPFTGDALLRTGWPNLIHLRASYDEETETMVERLIQDLNIKRIAVLYQNDRFGRNGYEGVKLALARRNLEPAASGVYVRNTSAVKTALVDIRKAKPEAVIIIAAYHAAAALIRWSRYTGFDPVFMAISFVGSNALANVLGEKGVGVFVTQVVPFPTASDLPITVSYLQALAIIAPEINPGFVSLEGYLTGRLIIEVLRRIGRTLTRKSFFEVFQQAKLIDLDGFKLYYGEGISQGSDSVFLTAINNIGRYQPIDRLTDVTECVKC